MKKTTSVMLVVLIAFSLLLVHRTGTATTTVSLLTGPVHNVNTGSNYATIQEAIDAPETLSGHTITVDPGLYTENITVYKSLNLVGADQQTTIIDGNLAWAVILVNANYVNITGFTIQNSLSNMKVIGTIVRGSPWGAIGLNGSVGCTITNNTIQRCTAGVAIGTGSGNTTVSDNNIIGGGFTAFGVISVVPVGGNTITDNNITFLEGIDILNGPNNKIAGNQLNCTVRSIYLYQQEGNIISNNTINGGTSGGIDALASDNNVISNNTITAAAFTLNACSNSTIRDNNVSSFDVEGSELSHFLHNIDTSNTVNGRPIYYLVNQSNLLINPFTYPDMGYLGLVNSRNMSVWRLTIADNTQGLMLAQTTKSKIDEVVLSNDAEGIYMWNSSENTIMGSTITSSVTGIDMSLCENNMIRGNTILGSVGISLAGSVNNTFYRNNLHYIILQDQLSNEWDDRHSTFTSGWEPRPVGNYWDDYTGHDDGTQTPGLINIAGDGIGDTLLPCAGVDNYPLMKPWIPVLGDVDYNGIVNMLDLATAAKNFGKTSP